MTKPQDVFSFGAPTGPQYGEATRDDPKAEEAWARADKLQAEAPGPGGSRWVPKWFIEIRRDILPRGTNDETVERYRWVSEDLPPVTVQRGTFVLLDGWHRWEATFSDFIRIIEVDVPDEELALYAFISNLHHGKPYELKDRLGGLEKLLGREPWASMSTNQLAALVGLDRRTVEKKRPKTNSPRVGADGRTRATGTNAQVDEEDGDGDDAFEPEDVPSRGPVSSFDPGRDEEPDDEYGADFDEGAGETYADPSPPVEVRAPSPVAQGKADGSSEGILRIWDALGRSARVDLMRKASDLYSAQTASSDDDEFIQDGDTFLRPDGTAMTIILRAPAAGIEGLAACPATFAEGLAFIEDFVADMQRTYLPTGAAR